MKVLIVDDEPALAELIEIVLDSAGHESTVVHGGEAALDELRDGSFDVVLSDYQMPGMNGLELLRQSRAELATSPPFVFVTGSAGARRELLDGGGAGYLAKPFAIKALLDAVDAAVSSPRIGTLSHGTPTGADSTPTIRANAP